MNNDEFKKEELYLAQTQRVLNLLIAKNDGIIKNEEASLQSLINYIAENPSVDKAEIVNNEMHRTRNINTIKHLTSENDMYKRIKNIPYFAKLYLNFEGDKEDIYIGVKNITQDRNCYVIDWRAPICSLYYDSNIGRASYNSPSGEVFVDLLDKRQLKIENGELKYYIDTNEQVNDEMLMDALNENSSAYMKNIVSTIQKNQNQIIRQDSYINVLVNGVAGSGKTSVGMHRIAYLLFHDNENLKNENVLIISPNKMFSQYISRVLPELGEENVSTKNMTDIFNGYIFEIGKAQEKEEIIDEILTCDKKRFDQMQTKYTAKYLNMLLNYLSQINNADRIKEDLVIDKKSIPVNLLQKLYYKPNSFNICESIKITTDRIIDEYFYNVNKKQDEIRKKIKSYFYKKVFTFSVLEIYTSFLNKIGFSDKIISKKIVNYEDLPGILLVKYLFLGVEQKYFIKQIFVDEIQDYDAITLYLLRNLYPKSNVTMVGDYNQNLLFESNNLDAIKIIYDSVQYFSLETNYRSTYNIAKFANDVVNKPYNSDFVRMGKEPEILISKDFDENLEKIKIKLKELSKIYKHIAVICKNEKESQIYYDFLVEQNFNVARENIDNDKNTIIVTTVFYSKGLEFDAVIIPDVSSKKYNTKIDKNILYVACTRALHELYLYSFSDLTKLIKDDKSFKKAL